MTTRRGAEAAATRRANGNGDTIPAKRDKVEVSSPVATWQPFPVEALPEPVRAFVVAGSKALGIATAYLGRRSLRRLHQPSATRPLSD